MSCVCVYLGNVHNDVSEIKYIYIYIYIFFFTPTSGLLQIIILLFDWLS